MATEITYDWQVAISFAGEDRMHADMLARILKDNDISVFYDIFERHVLWGKDLYQHLSDVYKNKARYCVVFISQHYAVKRWPKHELHNVQARIFREDEDYILPIRVDNTELPGLNETVGYLRLEDIGIEEVANILLRKLGLAEHDIDVDLARANWDGNMTTYNGTSVTSYWPPRIEEAQVKSFYRIRTVLERVAWGNERHNKRRQLGPCGDCAALPGQHHVPGCDMEYCPCCGQQALGCSCQKVACEPPS